MLSSDMNNLIYSGKFDGDALRRIGAAIHNLEKQGYKSINFDFRDMTGAYAGEMLPFAAIARHLLHKGIDTYLDLPSDLKLRKLFVNSNWAFLIDPRTHEQSEFEPRNHLPAIIYRSPDDHYTAIDRIVDLLLRTLPNFEREKLAPLEWAINEITDNVLNHAESDIGGIVQVSSKNNGQQIEFVVCDVGLGIPKTLRATHTQISSDTEALDRAIREGVTRNSATNMGNGLFGTYRLAQLSKGHFSIYSRFSSLRYAENHGLSIRSESIPYPGSIVVCTIDISDPDILSEALSFRGKRYTPSYTYIDRIIDEGCVVELHKESRSFGSRESAKPVRIKIMNILNSTDGKIKIDIGDIPLISSSFADEIFGKIFFELGPLTFMSRIEVAGGNRVTRQLIDRAISQRMALLSSNRT